MIALTAESVYKDAPKMSLRKFEANEVAGTASSFIKCESAYYFSKRQNKRQDQKNVTLRNIKMNIKYYF